MTEHDPMCGMPEFVRRGDPGCQCDLIAEVRADERSRTRGIIEELENHIDHLPQHTLADLHGKVAALPAEHHYGSPPRCISRADVLDLIDGSNDE